MQHFLTVKAEQVRWQREARKMKFMVIELTEEQIIALVFTAGAVFGITYQEAE